jgi:hypothetical protein
VGDPESAFLFSSQSYALPLVGVPHATADPAVEVRQAVTVREWKWTPAVVAFDAGLGWRDAQRRGLGTALVSNWAKAAFACGVDDSQRG